MIKWIIVATDLTDLYSFQLISRQISRNQQILKDNFPFLMSEKYQNFRSPQNLQASEA